MITARIQFFVKLRASRSEDCTFSYLPEFALWANKTNGIETVAKKVDWPKIRLFIKNPQFQSNYYETWWKWPTHELVKLPEYQLDWVKIVDFLLIFVQSIYFATASIPSPPHFPSRNPHAHVNVWVKWVVPFSKIVFRSIKKIRVNQLTKNHYAHHLTETYVAKLFVFWHVFTSINYCKL